MQYNVYHCKVSFCLIYNDAKAPCAGCAFIVMHYVKILKLTIIYDHNFRLNFFDLNAFASCFIHTRSYSRSTTHTLYNILSLMYTYIVFCNAQNCIRLEKGLVWENACRVFYNMKIHLSCTITINFKVAENVSGMFLIRVHSLL